MLLWADTIRGPLRLVAVVGLLLAAAPTAAASCGDYVHVPGRTDPSDPTPPPGSPCAHGECDRPSDSTPPPTSPVPPGPSATDAALAEAVALGLSRGRPGWAEPAGLPTSAPSSVFHPPRA